MRNMRIKKYGPQLYDPTSPQLNPFAPPREWKEDKALSSLEEIVSWSMTKKAFCGGLFALTSNMIIGYTLESWDFEHLPDYPQIYLIAAHALTGSLLLCRK